MKDTDKITLTLGQLKRLVKESKVSELKRPIKEAKGDTIWVLQFLEVDFDDSDSLMLFRDMDEGIDYMTHNVDELEANIEKYGNSYVATVDGARIAVLRPFTVQ